MNVPLRALILAAVLPLLAAAAPGDDWPVPVERVQPTYPRNALRDGIEGFVTLDIEVLADGRTAAMRVLNSAPGDVFVEAALAAVAQWRFTSSPKASRRGIQTIEFKIGDGLGGVSYSTPPEQWPVIKETPQGIMLVPPKGALGAPPDAPEPAVAVTVAAARETHPAPVPVERIKPIYPGDAWTARMEGYVRVEIEVLANGRVGAIKTLDAEHGDVFGPAVLAAVKRWRFEPSKYASRSFIQRIDFARRVVILPSLMPVPDTPYFNPEK